MEEEATIIRSAEEKSIIEGKAKKEEREKNKKENEESSQEAEPMI